VSRSQEPSFVAVPFDGVGAAEDALAAVDRLVAERGATVHDAAVVVRTITGHIELVQSRQYAAGEGIVAGGAVGLVAGMLLGLPIVGALLGFAGGAGFGLRDTGLPDKRLRRLGAELERGHALLCVLVDDGDLPAAREALAGYGEVVTVGLSATVDP
jgi:uncharacterized membrane protein